MRDAGPADAVACAAIYAPYVRDTAISFELEPPGAEQMAARIAPRAPAHAWVVLEDEGAVAGYAYGAQLHSRPAYRFSCEVSVYVETRAAAAAARAGALRGAVRAAAGARLSQRRRRDDRARTRPARGCTWRWASAPSGTYTNIGYKLGRWHDVAYFQLELAEPEHAAGASRAERA